MLSRLGRVHEVHSASPASQLLPDCGVPNHLRNQVLQRGMRMENDKKENENEKEALEINITKLDKVALKDLAQSLIEENTELQKEIGNLQLTVERVNKIASKATDLNTMYNRLNSDFENYRKRNAEIETQAKDEGIISAALMIIPVYDNLLRALLSFNDGKDKEGLKLILRQFDEVLTNMNIKPIDALNKDFDHNLHDGISCVKPESPEMENKVVQVVSNGYIYKDKVIKHAQVIVASD